MRNIDDQNEYHQILDRIQKLSPETDRLWGKMSVNEMICHISDPIRDVLGIRITEPVTPEEIRPKIIEMVLTETDWDRNLPTFPPYLQGPGGGGTKPTDFEADKLSMIDLVNRYHSLDPNFKLHPHAGLGILTREQCGMFLWKHTDHHLRQFGV